MYETVIGLEVHVELATATKMFCGCPNQFGAPPNSLVCPVCAGLPGALPVPNAAAVDLAVRAALALNCTVGGEVKFDRKNYFYPDLPKGYQISQYDQPVGTQGWLEVGSGADSRRVRIRRVHLEEDAGKLGHQPDHTSLVDLNRCGVPLIEIVSEPDISSPAEARGYLEELRAILSYTGVSAVRMEEGNLRCDANISLRPAGSAELGTLVELKNLNSFRGVVRALEHEEARQAEMLAAGEPVVRETRHWDERRQVTVRGRSKEEANDYRYFPDPDLLPLVISAQEVAAAAQSLPELPAARRRRLVQQFGLGPADAALICQDPARADLFEATVARHPVPRTVSNWVVGDVLRVQNALGDRAVGITATRLASLLDLVAAGTVNLNTARAILDEVAVSGADPAQVVAAQGLTQVSAEDELAAVVDRVLADNPDVVVAIRGGRDRALGFLVGQVMKATGGRAKPDVVNRLVRQRVTGD